MSDYQPGTVAEIRPLNAETTTRAIRHRNDGWVTADFGYFKDNEVADVRPLVVLDLEQVPSAPGWAYVVEGLRHDAKGYDKTLIGLADQIEAQSKPPRIPEPGLWGVVEAKPGTNPDAERQEFVRYPDDNPEGHWESKWYGSMKWDELVDPVLIREGVES